MKKKEIMRNLFFDSMGSFVVGNDFYKGTYSIY